MRVIRVRLILTGLLLRLLDLLRIGLLLYTLCRQGRIARSRSAIYRSDEVRRVSDLRLLTNASGLSELNGRNTSARNDAAANVAVRLNRGCAVRIRTIIRLLNYVCDVLAHR